MNIYEVMKRIPHRFPFLLVDKVVACEPDKSIEIIKNVSMNEPFFQGHFPEFPVFPGVLVTEAMAQATGLLTFESIPPSELNENSMFLLVGIDNARFKKQIIPGDVLHIRAQILRKTRNIWKFSAEATVENQLVCAAEIMGAMITRAL
ncbi:MAG TPA: 3-hydroxyacyl-ACP dehydratase FabZ [Gammaproteobacteria bacterium]